MPENAASESQGRLSIIGAIKTPLSFFALAVLIGEAGLLAFAAKAEGIDRTIGIIGMILLLLASCAAVYFLSFRGKTETKRFCRQIEGFWWERINHSEGSNLSFMSFTCDHLTEMVVAKGISYGKDGQFCATWQSEMARLYPADFRINYFWRGKHPTPKSVHINFHGFGTFEFQANDDSTTTLTQGQGHFWVVDETNPHNTVVKPVVLHRITNDVHRKTMTTGSTAEKRDVVLKVLSEW